MVQEMFRVCEARNGTEFDELLQTGMGTKELKLRVFVDDITALLTGRNKYLAEVDQEGGADGIPLLSQESYRTHQSACRQQRNHRWSMERRKEMHRSESW